MSQTPFSHGRGSATRSPVYARGGMVCASQPLAVQVGVSTLQAGGSAVDAAIATNACLGLMEPTANGVGGDLFAMVWDPVAQTLAGLNASGRAPAALTVDRVVPSELGTVPTYSPFSWNVPGCVDGWAELHARFGRLPWAALFQPAIAFAEEGFPLSPVIAFEWRAGSNRHRDKPGFAEVFMPGGQAPAAGQVFCNPALASTLRAVAEGGRDAYYRGAVAAAIVRFSEANSGFFALEDFERHASAWVEPISTTYRDFDVFELPPPGQGLAAL
ncbi:MAG: gamma-glutamyltransferase, partial [Dehalococcoidia bacterium]